LTTTRVEAFSDGVFAVAITVLVFGVTVPPLRHGTNLTAELLKQWPSFVAYAVSFLIIGIIWVNHHTIFSHFARVNRPLLFLNVFLLMTVAFIPFPTALLATYLTSGTNSHLAAAVYSAAMLLMSIAFTGLWAYGIWRPALLKPDITPAVARSLLPRFGLGVVFYLATIGIAFISAFICLAVHAALAIYYVFNQLSTDGAGPAEPGETVAAGEE
jgi:uncharacterized membrane protein